MDDDFECYDTDPTRLDWTAPILVACVLINGIAKAVSDAARSAGQLVVSHSDWLAERRAFSSEVGRDIESLTGRSDA